MPTVRTNALTNKVGRVKIVWVNAIRAVGSKSSEINNLKKSGKREEKKAISSGWLGIWWVRWVQKRVFINRLDWQSDRVCFFLSSRHTQQQQRISNGDVYSIQSILWEEWQNKKGVLWQWIKKGYLSVTSKHENKNFAVMVCNRKIRWREERSLLTQLLLLCCCTLLLLPLLLLLLLLVMMFVVVTGACNPYISLCPALFPFFPFFPFSSLLFFTFINHILPSWAVKTNTIIFSKVFFLLGLWSIHLFLFTILGFSCSYWRLGCRQDQLACPLYPERIQPVRQ